MKKTILIAAKERKERKKISGRDELLLIRGTSRRTAVNRTPDEQELIPTGDLENEACRRTHEAQVRRSYGF